MLANFVAGKPFTDLNTSLKPQKSSVELILEKWKHLKLTKSLLLPHMEVCWQVWGHFCHFWTILTIFRPVTPTDDPLTTFQCYIRWIKAVIPLEWRAFGRNNIFFCQKGVKKWSKLPKNAIPGPCWPILDNVSAMSSEQYLKGQH